MPLTIIALLLAALGVFCRSTAARRLLWAAALLALVAALSFPWAGAQLAAAGCTGDILGDLVCPAPDLLTRLAMAHLTFGVLALSAGAFAAPTVMILAIWLEMRHRRRQDAEGRAP